jgi:hypothetical protein
MEDDEGGSTGDDGEEEEEEGLSSDDGGARGRKHSRADAVLQRLALRAASGRSADGALARVGAGTCSGGDAHTTHHDGHQLPLQDVYALQPACCCCRTPALWVPLPGARAAACSLPQESIPCGNLSCCQRSMAERCAARCRRQRCGGAQEGREGGSGGEARGQRGPPQLQPGGPPAAPCHPGGTLPQVPPQGRGHVGGGAVCRPDAVPARRCDACRGV